MKRGRPRIPDQVADAAMRLRDLGVPWSDIEAQVGVSRRTVLRRIRGFENRGQNSAEGDERV
jgi:hypothetical protein